MSDLSPAAQAVLTAVMRDQYELDPADIPNEAAWISGVVAAALRAAVEQVLPKEPLYGGDQRWMYERDAHQERRKKLLAIATELENYQ